MKYILILFTAICLIQCKTKKSATTPVATPAYAPSEKELSIAQKNWPNSTTEQLQEGNTIYRTKCTKCHENFEITSFSEKKWKHEINDMAPKAKLTDLEKENLSKFILSYREANTVAPK